MASAAAHAQKTVCQTAAPKKLRLGPLPKTESVKLTFLARPA